VITGPAEYQDISIQSSQVCLHVSQLKPDIQDYRLLWAFSLMLETT